jgi:hypothetical protein
MLGGVIDGSGVFQMKRIYLAALAAGLLTSLPASLMAQTPTDTQAPAAAPAPAASPAAPAPAASPAAPAPAATPAPAASPSASEPPADTGKKTATKKKSSGKRMTRQQEIHHSIESGTVPSRYRSQVPREYQQYIPFDKR